MPKLIPANEAKLIALGEELKAAWGKQPKFEERVHALYPECIKAARYEHGMSEDERDAAEQRFKVKSRENGHNRASAEWNAAGKALTKIARAIWKIPPRTTRGLGIRAAAAMVLNEDCENMHEIGELLWGFAANAGFKPPTDVARKLKHKVDFAPVVESA